MNEIVSNVKGKVLAMLGKKVNASADELVSAFLGTVEKLKVLAQSKREEAEEFYNKASELEDKAELAYKEAGKATTYAINIAKALGDK